MNKNHIFFRTEDEKTMCIIPFRTYYTKKEYEFPFGYGIYHLLKFKTKNKNFYKYWEDHKNEEWVIILYKRDGEKIYFILNEINKNKDLFIIEKIES
jgi:hypothetical protein